MSNITGLTFPNQNVPPKADGRLATALLRDGVISGCELSFSGATVTIGAGSLIAAGRHMLVESDVTLAMNAYTGVARIIVDIDTTKTATQADFEQADFDVQYALSRAALPALEKEDINGSGTHYQLPVALLDLAAGTVSAADYLLAPAYSARPMRRMELTGAAAITCEDETLYSVASASSLTINCPDAAVSGSYMCHIIAFFTGTPSITISGAENYTGYDLQTASSGDTWEFSILNGYVIGQRWT